MLRSAKAKKASGGAIDLGGVYLDNGQLFVNAGYGTLGQIAGNAFCRAGGSRSLKRQSASLCIVGTATPHPYSGVSTQRNGLTKLS